MAGKRGRIYNEKLAPGFNCFSCYTLDCYIINNPNHSRLFMHQSSSQRKKKIQKPKSSLTEEIESPMLAKAVCTHLLEMGPKIDKNRSSKLVALGFRNQPLTHTLNTPTM